MKLRAIAVLSVAIISLSCGKKDNSPQTIYHQTFTWTFGSTTYVSDSSVALLNNGSGKPAIRAWDGGATLSTFKIGFAITSFTLGGHNIVTTIPGPNPSPPISTTNNLYYFDDNGNELPVINGAINILAYANERISGNFTANLLDDTGANKFLVGSFTDVQVKP